MSNTVSDGQEERGPVLSVAEQRRNLLVFATCTGMQYLAAPVLYVGVTQGSLCNELGADTREANLPGTLYFAMTAMPALLAWLSPSVAVLKRNLSACYLICAAMLALVAVALALPISDRTKLGVVILQAGVSGAVIPAAIALLWEAVGRGTDEVRRGMALGLAFGVGPLLAVLGSLGQSALLGGHFFGTELPGRPYPQNFILLFAISAPVIAVAGIAAWWLVIPSTDDTAEPEREWPIGLLLGLPMMFASVMLLHFAGEEHHERRYVAYVAATIAAAGLLYHFRAILRHRVLLTATVVTILVYAGNVIPTNMNLYSEIALGGSPTRYAGEQNTLRFGCKVIAGLGLGWLLTRSTPRAGVLVTAGIFLAAQLWALLVTGPWYLLAFGLHGAGELIGVYAPNYIVSASRADQLRRNMAFVTMLMVPAAPAGYLYGAIVEHVRAAGWSILGMNSTALGFRLSFLVCALLILCGMILALARLPAVPKREESASG